MTRYRRRRSVSVVRLTSSEKSGSEGDQSGKPAHLVRMTRFAWVLALAVGLPGCSDPEPGADNPTQTDTGSSGQLSSGLGTQSTTSANDDDDDDDDSATTSSDDSATTMLGTEGGDESTAGCVDACEVGRGPTCDGTIALECVRPPNGCLAELETPCEERRCIDGIGCVEVVPADCAEIHESDPLAPDGAYMIDPDGLGGAAAFEAQCDMSNDGGGWTLVARNDQPTSFDTFDQDWDAYRDGFGDLPGGQSGWIGNERLHVMTAGGLELQVRHDMGVHEYADFEIGDEPSLYELSVSSTPASADGGNFAGYHSGHSFSTFDQDNDTDPDNCASDFSAGWWYADCYIVSIAAGNATGGVYWSDGAGGPDFVAWIEMWVR